MVGHSRSHGFALLEFLAIMGLLQFLLWLSWPSFQGLLQNYRCQQAVLRLAQEVTHKRILAMTEHEPQVLRLQTLPANIHWYGFIKHRDLYFSTDIFANRLNGFFQIQCGRGRGYRLWLNRLGHYRIESI